MDSTDRPDPTGPTGPNDASEPGPRAEQARRRSFTAEYKARFLAE
ncbi:hypothetical protein [Kineococcus sp. SYSU DK003]